MHKLREGRHSCFSSSFSNWSSMWTLISQWNIWKAKFFTQSKDWDLTSISETQFFIPKTYFKWVIQFVQSNLYFSVQSHDQSYHLTKIQVYFVPCIFRLHHFRQRDLFSFFLFSCLSSSSQWDVILISHTHTKNSLFLIQTICASVRDCDDSQIPILYLAMSNVFIWFQLPK